MIIYGIYLIVIIKRKCLVRNIQRKTKLLKRNLKKTPSNTVSPTSNRKWPKTLMMFFEDQAAFGRMNHLGKCWVHRPDRAIVKKQVLREYLYAFTTVCPQTGETCSIISPFCNTQAMNALLLETSISFPNYSITMIMDSAGWHTSKKLKLPQNISILPLPPYSPELNPTEHSIMRFT